ncbi:MAG TPA: hypothetical protein VF784_12380 [Anaerolineales bacterium]
MKVRPDFMHVNGSCGETVRRVQRSLAHRGLRVLATFDLREARSSLEDCPCPYHGTADCDCQMVVLLVYSEGMAPTTLVLHGNDGQTLISLSDDPAQEPHPLIRAAVEEVVKDRAGEEGL